MSIPFPSIQSLIHSFVLLFRLIPVLLLFAGVSHTLAGATLTSTTQSAFQSDRFSWQQTLTGSLPVTESTQAGLQIGMGGASGKHDKLLVLDPQVFIIGQASAALSVRLALRPGWGTRSRTLEIQNRWDGGLALSPPEYSLVGSEKWAFQLGLGLSYWQWEGRSTASRLNALSAYEGAIPNDWGTWVSPRLGLSVSDSIEIAFSLNLLAGEWGAQKPFRTSEVATQLEVNYQWSRSVHVHSHLRHQSFGIRLRDEAPSILSIGMGMEIQVW